MATQFAVQCWFDDNCILDMDCFVKTVSRIKKKGVHPDLIASIIVRYASKWIPALSDDESTKLLFSSKVSPESIASSWMKKRFFIETLVGILPPEKNSVSCNFLLRLLRVANMVGTVAGNRAELEKRIARQLDQASLKEMKIPAFSHACGTLLDIELVHRLVKRFVGQDEATRTGSALAKVAKLIDCYLAEAAVDANFALSEFVALSRALPSHARTTDDGLYHAVDTYLKAHPNMSKQERNTAFQLIDIRKLTPDATFHALQNERLPVGAVIQVFFSEQWKLSGNSSPNPAPETPARCLLKRQVTAHQMEIQKLREDVERLQSQCNAMQAQIQKLTHSEKKCFFRWRAPSMPLLRPSIAVKRMDEAVSGEAAMER